MVRIVEGRWSRNWRLFSADMASEYERSSE
jgi:hypothetical protein